jgi:hypothetical protein
LLGNDADCRWTCAMISARSQHDQPGIILPDHVQQHLDDRALPQFRVTVNTLVKKVSCHLVKCDAGVLRELPQHAAGDGFNRRIVNRIKAVRQDNARSVRGRELAGIL